MRQCSSLLTPLILTNGLTVSALYWAQALVGDVQQSLGSSPIIRLMPGATLAGYALGVALLAGIARDLTAPRALGLHAALLVAGLCLAAAAPMPGIAASAFLLIGVGCSLTQRLLACATTAVPTAQRAQTIGWIIAAGLCGIVLARALVAPMSAALGWRAMFWAASAAMAVAGALATQSAMRINRQHGPCQRDAAPAALGLWRGKVVLRRASVQQALVFAAFNLAWAAFPRALSGTGAHAALLMGAVASLGAVAAIVSGRICSRRDPARVATVGLVTVLLASITLLAVGHPIGARSAEMALLDIGTQVALVANQVRAQALDLSPATRGRLAAIVTTVGFAGGAVGAAIGNLLT